MWPPYFQTTPPTAYTEHCTDLKIGMDAHLDHTFGVIEAIFEFLPLSWDMGENPPQGWNRPTPISRLRGGISKIASMTPKVFPRWVFMPNLKPLPWAVRAVGGVVKIGGSHLLNRANMYDHFVWFIWGYFVSLPKRKTGSMSVDSRMIYFPAMYSDNLVPGRDSHSNF